MSTEPKPLYSIFTALALYSSWIVPCIYFPSHRPSPLTLNNERACVLRLLQLLCMAPSSPRSIYCPALRALNSVCNCPPPFCQHTEVRIYTRMRQKVETKPWVRKDPFAMFSPTFGHYPNGLGLNIKKGLSLGEIGSPTVWFWLNVQKDFALQSGCKVAWPTLDAMHSYVLMASLGRQGAGKISMLTLGWL